MKIEIFSDGKIQRLQDEINEWLADNPGITIHHVLQSESDGEEGYTVTVSILYMDFS